MGFEIREKNGKWTKTLSNRSSLGDLITLYTSKKKVIQISVKQFYIFYDIIIE